MSQEKTLFNIIGPTIIHKQYPQVFRLSELEGKANNYEGSDESKQYYPDILQIERVTYKCIYRSINRNSSCATYERKLLEIKL